MGNVSADEHSKNLDRPFLLQSDPKATQTGLQGIGLKLSQSDLLQLAHLSMVMFGGDQVVNTTPNPRCLLR